MAFDHVVSSEAELRELLGSPAGIAVHKVVQRLDAHCREFIARSPLLLLATASASGECDVSPRGDAPGFVRVLDERRLVIPERMGNRRVDSLLNILANPRAGLLFLIPGLRETLRINGRASVLRDPSLLREMEANGKVPQVAIGVEVEECYLHCGKALIRSRLWDPGSWPEAGSLPSPARIFADHAGALCLSSDEVEERLKESYTKRLY